ncbi:LacI family DNA-binding transcriptional regulator [Sinomicrobium soli]|uniref:LacI family DNA-binding transcriptional regulator n=1 Tax=Sinomicrobium sp. N-1-3-6 TaxID=2219864 RepID=UPI000DCB2C6F|nr:LacI family DNA-binding transcriptional regulator [Sinomicrobium sp. N-1-3-6]RAV28557.1 LacI family transcriptional regulator [Sinomicrobium sp. N-1-3-6]
MSQVTLKDIASILGVSVTTVSKALKDYPDISNDTKHAVKLLADKLNYKPNIHAVTLRSNQSRTIGAILPKVDHQFFAETITGIISEANIHGYQVIVLFSDESVATEERQVDLLLEKRVDGILMSLANETNRFGHLHKVVKNQVPLVLFDKITRQVNCSKVIIDDEKAAYKAVNHMIKTGCRNIGILSGPEFPSNYNSRLRGYIRALEEHGMAYDDSRVFSCGHLSIEEGRENAETLLKNHPDTDGIFCITDHIALGTISYLNDAGIPVPGQVSVMGFSNWMITPYIKPHLSTVDQPSTQMGKESASLLINEIERKHKKQPVEFYEIKLQTHLVLRETTRS